MYMRAFAAAYPDEAIVQEALGQITWYHNITLVEKVKDREERLWYVQKTIGHGWNWNVLVHHIEGTSTNARAALSPILILVAKHYLILKSLRISLLLDLKQLSFVIESTVESGL